MKSWGIPECDGVKMSPGILSPSSVDRLVALDFG
jgi:hypothetical protein